MRISSLASLGPGALDAICEGLGDKSLSIRLLAGIDVDSAAPSHAMWELGRVAAASAVVSAAFAAGPDQVLDRLRASDTADARGLPRAVRPVPVRLRLAGAERIRHLCRVVGGQAAHRPRGHRPDAPLRRLAGARQPQRRDDRRTRPGGGRDSGEDRRRPRDGGPVRSRDGVGTRLPQRARTSEDQRRDGDQRDPRRDSGVRSPPRRSRRSSTTSARCSWSPTPNSTACATTPSRCAAVIQQRYAVFRSLFDFEPVFIVNGDRPGPDRHAPARRRVDARPSRSAPC